MSDSSVFAALLAEIEDRVDLDPASELLAFPEFVLRLGLRDLVFDALDLAGGATVGDGKPELEAQRNREQFALLVNAIPVVGAEFSSDGRMVWSVVEQVLSRAEVPAAAHGDLAEQTALLFQQAREALAVARRASTHGDGTIYFVTTFEPQVDVRDEAAWTRIEVDLTSAGAKAPSALSAAWLKAKGLESHGAGAALRVNELKCEILPLTIIRHWLPLNLLLSSSWRWDEGVLSDGGDPPSGVMPALVRRIVLVRRVEGVLVPASDTSSAPELTGAGDLLGLQNRATGESARFPVPITFDVQAASRLVTRRISESAEAQRALDLEVAGRQKQVDELGRELAKVEGVINRYPARLHEVTVHDHRDGPNGPRRVARTINLDERRQRASALAREMVAARHQLETAESRSRDQGDVRQRLESVRSELEALDDARAGDDDVFVLAFVTTRLSQCPVAPAHLFAPKGGAVPV